MKIESKLPAHFMVSVCDGGLYDTRKPNWSESPVRKVYKWHFGRIENSSQLKATIRAGGFAWPGGYPIYFVTHDGAALCFDCVRKEYRRIVSDYTGRATGWRVDGTAINYEDQELCCEHCNKAIPAAYGEDKE